jgi:hypothetical protein
MASLLIFSALHLGEPSAGAHVALDLVVQHDPKLAGLWRHDQRAWLQLVARALAARGRSSNTFNMRLAYMPSGLDPSAASCHKRLPAMLSGAAGRMREGNPWSCRTGSERTSLAMSGWINRWLRKPAAGEVDERFAGPSAP